jgi:hypothetical protein
VHSTENISPHVIKREPVTPWFWAPVIALLILLAAIVALPWKKCEQFPHIVDGTGAQHDVVGIAIVASLVIGMAAAVHLAAICRERGLPVPPWPALWAVPVVALGAFALIKSPELRSGFAVVGIVGSPAAVIGFFGVAGVQSDRGYAREARAYLPVYLFGSAFALYPSLAILALNANAHPFCGFG